MPKCVIKNLLPSHDQRKKLQRVVKKCLHIGKPEEEWSGWELQLCNLVTWVGALVVTAVVLRSLYLMYLKPEGTWLYRFKKSIYMKARNIKPLEAYTTQIRHVVAWTGVLFLFMILMRTLYLKYNDSSELRNS